MQSAGAPRSAPATCRCVPAKCHNRRSELVGRAQRASPRKRQQEIRGRAAPSCAWPSAPRRLSILTLASNRARRAVAKLNLLLLAVLVACALGLVTSQHKARQAVLRARARAGARARARRRVSASCSSRRAPGGCTRGSSGSPRARSACARPIRAACASSAPRRRGGERAPTQGAGAPAGLARALRAVALARRLRACSAARALYLQALRHRIPAGEGRRALLARARDAGDARPHPRPQRRRARGLDAGEVDLGDSRATSSVRRRSSSKLAALLDLRRARRCDKKLARQLARLRLPQAPDVARNRRGGRRRSA